MCISEENINANNANAGTSHGGEAMAIGKCEDLMERRRMTRSRAPSPEERKISRSATSSGWMFVTHRRLYSAG